MDLRAIVSFDELTNEAERLVIDELGVQLDDATDACMSEDCILDMAAFALNRIRPMYRVNLLGRLYADSLKEEYRAEIRSAVRDAIRTVASDQRR